MSKNAPKAPSAPKAPEKAAQLEAEKAAQLEAEKAAQLEAIEELPNVLMVKNKQGKKLKVNKAYYEANSHKLTIITDA